MVNMDIKSERHGGNVPLSWIDFSISVNPYPAPFLEEVLRQASKYSTQYIYCGELENDLSALIGADIHLTAGITEALYLLFMSFNGGVTIPDPSFSEYERTARCFRKHIHKTENILEDIRENGIAILCNPANPTGKYYQKEEVEYFIRNCEAKNTIPVLDEAFIDFVENHHNRFYRNAIHLRTFTKSYGLPGIRVGYFYDPFRKMNRAVMPWNIGSIGKAFVEKIIEDQFSHLKSTLPVIRDEKRRIEKELPVKSDANYFILEVVKKGELLNYLASRKIMVRDCASFGLDDFIRFSIRTPRENDQLLPILKEHQR